MKILLIFKDWSKFQVTMQSINILKEMCDCIFIAEI